MRIEHCSLVALVGVMLGGCHRPAEPGGQKASSGGAEAAAVARPASEAKVGERAAEVQGVEVDARARVGADPALVPLAPEASAERATLGHDGYRALLAPVLDAVHRRFRGVPDAELRVQAVALPADGRAVLVEGAGGRPVMTGFDAQGRVSWFKERVVDDLDPALGGLTLSAGAKGDIVLVFHDPPTGSLAARRWDAAGGLLADFKLLDVERVDAVAALPWPGHGWLVAASGGGSLRVQLLAFRGGLPWGAAGRQLNAAGVMPGPLAIALDTDVSALVLWPGPGATGRHQRASRLDLDGRDLWKTPADLGDAGDGAPGVARTGVGEVRADLHGKSGPYTVNLTADGRVLIQ